MSVPACFSKSNQNQHQHDGSCKTDDFYAHQLYRQVLLRARISYGNSACPSVCPSRPGTDSRPGEIETPGLHHTIA